MEKKSRYEEIKNVLFIVGIIGWVIFLIVPMPAFIIDLSLSLTIAFSMVVLIQASTIDTWDKFKTFPLVLLMATIFRIALSIATTRKIISGESPGQVIESAGHFIVGDKLAIGFVMFIILIIVQFIIAFGANRFGEVSARFTLDSLPGKQMSIDNDLNQGVIDFETARKQKFKLQQQVDYFGSLDGAGKYIKGDVWASVAMIVVNLVVGLIVGIMELNLTFQEALNRFTMLSIGDGVVTLISALMITVSGAIVMAKVEEENGEESDEPFLLKIFNELVPSGRNLFIVGSVLILLGLVGLPFRPLFIVGIVLIIIGFSTKRKKEKEFRERVVKEQLERQVETENKKVKKPVGVEPILVEVGPKLAPLFKDNGVDILGRKREDMKEKISLMRNYFLSRYGVEIPNVKIRDNITFTPSTRYEINIKETRYASGDLKEGKALAIPSLLTISEVEGIATKDPIFGQEAIWIDELKIDQAVDSGYDVWNSLSIISTHIHKVIENNIWQFVTLQKVSDLIEGLESDHPILKEKMDKKSDDLHLFQKVIISLLKEKVSIKDLPSIVESFLEASSQTKDIDTIISLVRQRISRQICNNYLNKDGKLYLLMLEGESEINVENHGGSSVIIMDYEQQNNLIERIKKEQENGRLVGVNQTIIVQRPELRSPLQKMLEAFEVDVPVISVFELPQGIENNISQI